MIRSLFLLLLIIASIILGIVLAQNLEKGHPGSLLVGFLGEAVLVGIIAVVYIIPAIGDKIGNFFYSPGESLELDPSAKAAAKVSAGDYEGAIEEYQKQYAENPENRFPVTEIAKIQLERLNDPQASASTIEGALNEKEWVIDDAAFFLFRLVDLYETHLGNKEQAADLLRQAIEDFDGTRHAANARHKLAQIEGGDA